MEEKTKKISRITKDTVIPIGSLVVLLATALFIGKLDTRVDTNSFQIKEVKADIGIIQEDTKQLPAINARLESIDKNIERLLSK